MAAHLWQTSPHMGLDLDRHEFSDPEFARFERRLQTDLEALRRLLARPGFGA